MARPRLAVQCDLAPPGTPGRLKPTSHSAAAPTALCEDGQITGFWKAVGDDELNRHSQQRTHCDPNHQVHILRVYCECEWPLPHIVHCWSDLAWQDPLLGEQLTAASQKDRRARAA
ncbi:hypothetical protein [Mangrovicoccus sp. HB161399]|nr:hypothetical protein [Mangrovicoccus sp. HB161399]